MKIKAVSWRRKVSVFVKSMICSLGSFILIKHLILVHAVYNDLGISRHINVSQLSMNIFAPAEIQSLDILGVSRTSVGMADLLYGIVKPIPPQ